MANTRTHTIPAKIHFIWVGGPIPEKYLRTISEMGLAAKNSGFEINLWLENESNYTTTSAKSGIEIPNLRLRGVDSLLDSMKDHPLVRVNEKDSLDVKQAKQKEDENLRQQFIKNVRREMVGFKNLAAVADLLRLEILRQEGGYYFDTDTYFTFQTSEEFKKTHALEEFRLQQDHPPFGILIYVKPRYVPLRDRTGNFESGISLKAQSFESANDIISCEAHHPVMELAVKTSIQEYSENDVSSGLAAKTY